VRDVIKASLIRGYRAFVYAFVSSAGVGNIGPIRNFAELKAGASVWALSLSVALGAGVVAFLVATAEIGSDRSLIGPKTPTLPNGKNGGE
jgi:hypothetical protein